MHRILPTAILTVLIGSGLRAQQLPLFTQYMFDPYLVNPSFVASGGQAEVNALYRRQWTQIQDGPKTIQFDAQLPINAKMAFGVNVYNDQSILLNATSVLFTYGYKVQLAQDHQLGFGLSAGAFMNRVNMSQIPVDQANDPAVLSKALNNTSMNAQFGAHYKFKNFTLGYSMVNLIQRETLSSKSFQPVSFNTLKNQIFFASYRFKLEENKFYLQPNFAYRISADNVNYYEASAIISYANVFDLGGGYRQNFGPTVMARFSWKQMQIGYAYDFPGNSAQISTGGTQEIQVKLRFGKTYGPAPKKTSSVPPLVIAPVQEEKPAEVPPAITPVQVAESTPTTQQEKPEAAKVPPTSPDQKVTEVAKTDIGNSPAAVTEQAVVPAAVAEKPVTAPPQTYYYVIGTFESQSNAQTFFIAAKKKGLDVQIIESGPANPKHYYYVHMPKYKSTEISIEKLMELQKSTGYKEAWFTKVN